MLGAQIPDQLIIGLILFIVASMTTFFVWLVKTIIRVLELLAGQTEVIANLVDQVHDHDGSIRALQVASPFPFSGGSHK